MTTVSSSSKTSNSHKGATLCIPDGEVYNHFFEMIKLSRHFALLKIPDQKYDVYIDRSSWHWMILVKAHDTDSEVGYFSLEVSTPNLIDLSREMFDYLGNPRDKPNLIICGTITGHKLIDIIGVADDVAARMGRYSLFSSNCQHFCNNFLNFYKFKTYRTTLGKEVTAVIQGREKTKQEKEAVDELLLASRRVHDELMEEDDPLGCTADSSDSSVASLSTVEIQFREVLAGMLNKYVGAAGTGVHSPGVASTDGRSSVDNTSRP